MRADHFKVIVVGGGPIGLTAAHSLHLAGIDFVVLEKRTTIIEDLGASLVLAPPSLRIMRQFRILEDLLAVGEEIQHSRTFDKDGNVLNDSTAILTLRKNHGSAPVAFHRAQLVEVVYDGLPGSAKENVHLGKKLSDIRSDDQGVLVTCEDGSTYQGSIAIGADGVHSKARRIMRKLALQSDPSLKWDLEQPFVSTYRCLWCSFPRPSDPGQNFDTQHKDNSVMYLTGRGRGWIFLYQKLPQASRERVSYTDSDIQAYVEEFGDFPVTDHLKVKDVWAKRLTAGMSNLEEGLVAHWSWGRIVLAGDAAHKFTPNAGLGFNTGIQDVVTLCNGLQSLQNTFLEIPPSPNGHMSLLARFLDQYQAERKERIPSDANRSAMVTRTQAWANPLYYLMARYILSLKAIEYFLLEHVAARSIKKALVLNYVDTDEPMKGLLEWDHPLNSLGDKTPFRV